MKVSKDRYEIGGRSYLRFSHVASFLPPPQLTEWVYRVGKKEAGAVRRKALKVGSRVDELCENDVKGEGYSLGKKDCDEVRTCMKAWEDWKRDWPERFEEINETQKTVRYDDWRVAGTLDFLAPERLTDLKTGKKISKGYWVQTAFYNRACKRPEKWVLLLHKTGGYTYKKCPEHYSQEYCEEIFVAMLNLYHFYNEEEWGYDDSGQ